MLYTLRSITVDGLTSNLIGDLSRMLIGLWLSVVSDASSSDSVIAIESLLTSFGSNLGVTGAGTGRARIVFRLFDIILPYFLYE